MTKKRNEIYAKRHIEYDVTIFSSEAERESVERREKYLAKIMRVRNLYKNDIIKHKDEMRAIMSGRNRSSYDKIFKIIPSYPSSYNLTKRTDYLPNGDLKYSSFGLSWQLFRPATPEPEMDKFSFNPYMEKGDTPLSDSLGAGRKKLTLWMSGRVTETTTTENPALQRRPIVDGTPSHIFVETEVEPPFDFLIP